MTIEPLSAEELAQLADAEERANEGPWIASTNGFIHAKEQIDRCLIAETARSTSDDAWFIALSRNKMRRLLAMVEALKAENERLNAEILWNQKETDAEAEDLKARLKLAEAVCEAAGKLKHTYGYGQGEAMVGFRAVQEALKAWRAATKGDEAYEQSVKDAQKVEAVKRINKGCFDE